MGVIDSILGRKTPDSMIMAAITAEGKAHAESYASGGPQFDVLATLNEKSPMTIIELSRETNLDSVQIKHVLTALLNEGYVRKIQPGQVV